MSQPPLPITQEGGGGGEVGGCELWFGRMILGSGRLKIFLKGGGSQRRGDYLRRGGINTLCELCIMSKNHKENLQNKSKIIYSLSNIS